MLILKSMVLKGVGGCRGAMMVMDGHGGRWWLVRRRRVLIEKCHCEFFSSYILLHNLNVCSMCYFVAQSDSRGLSACVVVSCLAQALL